MGKMSFKIVIRSVSSWCGHYKFACIMISAMKILVLKRIKFSLLRISWKTLMNFEPS